MPTSVRNLQNHSKHTSWSKHWEHQTLSIRSENLLYPENHYGKIEKSFGLGSIGLYMVYGCLSQNAKVLVYDMILRVSCALASLASLQAPSPIHLGPSNRSSPAHVTWQDLIVTGIRKTRQSAVTADLQMFSIWVVAPTGARLLRSTSLAIS